MLGEIRILSSLLVFLVHLAVPVGAQAESPVEVTRNEAIIDFPEKIDFYLDAESSQPIAEVEIEYGVERLACGVASSRKPVEFQPGTSLSVSWTWQMRVTGPLPPGSRVWWRWRITLEDGTEERTDKEWQTFEDGTHDWQILTQDDITIAWYDGDQSFAEDMLQAGIEALERLMADPQDVLQEPVKVFVYNSAQDLQDAVIFSPDWIGGRAYPSYSTILMAISPGRVEYGQEVLRHELSHLVVHQMTFNCWGNEIPPWLGEGLAVYAEGEQPYYDELVDDAIANDDLLTLQILSGSFSAHGDRANLSYAQSYRVVRYLIESYGRDKVLDLLAQIGDGVPIDKALEAIYGFDAAGLEAEWREAVGAQVRTEPTDTPTVTPETITSVEATDTVVPSPTPGITPTPGPVTTTLSYTPPGDLQEARLPPAPGLVGRDALAAAPIWPLVAGAVLIAVALALAVLAWRRRLPWWPAPLLLVAGVLLLVGYALAHRNAQTYNQAAEAFQQRQWADALAGFDRALTAQPAFLRLNAPLAQANRGAAALNLGQAGTARAALEVAIEAAPGHPASDLARTYLARWHLLYGQAGDALPLLDETLVRQPDLAPALSLRAEARWQQGNLEDAALDAGSALAAAWTGGDLAQDQVLGRAHAVRGAARLLKGEIDAAQADAEEALARSPALALAYAVRGGARLARAQTVDAYADAETALALEPELPLALAVRAAAQLDAGLPERAAVDAAAAHGAGPPLAWAHEVQALAAWQLHDAGTASSQAEAALALDPGAAMALAAQAGLALSEYHLDTASELAGQALEADPELGAALAVRSVVQLLQHRPAGALQDAEAAVRASPYLALAHAAHAAAALELGDLETALRSANQAISLDTNLALAYAARAGAHIRQSQIHTGLEDAEQAIGLDPDLALGYLWRGAAHLALDRLVLAEADLDRALALDGNLTLAQVHQADLALSRHDLEAALRLADAALEQDPDLALAHVWRALALDGMGEFALAGEAVAEALALDDQPPQAYLARAVLASRQGDVQEGLADLDTALNLDPRYAPAYQLRAWMRLGQGDYEGAQADAEQASNVLPSVETYATLAGVHRFFGRYAEALASLNRAEELAPESALPPISRVYIHQMLLDPAAAMSEAEEALAREPENPDAYLARAWLYQQQHDHEAARQDVDAALDLNPWSVLGQVLQASVQSSLGNQDAALASAGGALALAPGSSDARQIRGLLHLRAAHPEEALADLEKAVELEPGDPFRYFSRALAEAATDSVSQARDTAEQAIALLPDHPLVHANAAMVWLALNEPETAIEACDEALALDPDLASAYRLRGQSHLALNDPSEAIQDLSRALRLDRSDPEGYALRADAYLMQDRLEKALDEAERALDLDDRTARAHQVLCEAKYLQDDSRAALASCDEAVELAPGDARVYWSRGLARAWLGQLDEALADLDEAVRLAPDWLDAYLERADIKENQGDLEGAIADLEEARRLTEDTEVRRNLDSYMEALQNTQVAVDGPAIYTDDTLGFTLRYPEGWRAGPEPSGAGVVSLAGPMKEGYRPIAALYIGVTPHQSPSDLADETSRELRGTFSQFRVLDEKESQLGGAPAVLHVCQAVQPGVGDLKYWFVYAIHGWDGWILMFAAQVDQFDEAEPRFQEILDSFAFTD